jgi:hypothetical protein
MKRNTAEGRTDMPFYRYLKSCTFVKHFHDRYDDYGELYFLSVYYICLVILSSIWFVVLPLLALYYLVNNIFPYILEKTIGRFIRKKENEV